MRQPPWPWPRRRVRRRCAQTAPILRTALLGVYLDLFGDEFLRALRGLNELLLRRERDVGGRGHRRGRGLAADLALPHQRYRQVLCGPYVLAALLGEEVGHRYRVALAVHHLNAEAGNLAGRVS
ncbi:MAG: hypothetical protein MZV70_03470 [Desulfobacterales bacterium]|nr:hypothetical protein [Desulfobacterales bacterium]